MSASCQSASWRIRELSSYRSRRQHDRPTFMYDLCIAVNTAGIMGNEEAHQEGLDGGEDPPGG